MTSAPAVLVVGAGPVGLTLALELARRDTPVRVIDAAAGPAPTSRALATHARTLETYDQMGVLPAMLALGRRVEAFTLHQNGARLARLGANYRRLPTRFPYTLMIDQQRTEQVLTAALSRHGVEVEWGVALEHLTRRPDGVDVELRDGAGPQRLRVPWLVGCDGGHSTVRKQLDLRLIGESTETWLIADAEVEADLAQDSIHWLRTRAGTLMAVPYPEPGRWRLLDTTAAAQGGADADATDTDTIDPDAVAARFSARLGDGLGSPVRVATPTWVSVFTIQQRLLPDMRAGRCFVAGDAAHVHSPASGQGMNTGIQDAFNLGWKLAAVIAGTADQSLLDTYSTERVPVGETLLRATRTATALIQLRHPVAAAALPWLFRVVRAVAPLRHRIEGKIMSGMSGLALTYRDPALTVVDPSDRTAAGPRPGERMTQVAGPAAEAPGWVAALALLRLSSWTLLVADGSGTAARHPDRLAGSADAPLTVRLVAEHAHPVAGAATVLADPGGVLRADLGLAPGGWLLVRPDGYVAARGGRNAPFPAAVAALLAAGRTTAAAR